MNTIKVGIAGAAGYTGGELLRLLLNHPNVELVFAHSKSAAGKKWYEVHPDLLGISDRGFTSGLSQDVDVIFLCVGHGEAQKFIEQNELNPSIRIIDLSTDFRHKRSNTIGERCFVYGLPELNKQAIQEAKNIANPGCFATAIELALLPLAEQVALPASVQINATTGATGGGQKPSSSAHFPWRDNNLSIYKAFTHQHLQEIEESIAQYGKLATELNFIPQRGNFSRGIFATISFETDLSQSQMEDIYTSFYAEHPFTQVAPFEVALKHVVNTNFCYLGIQKVGKQVLLVSVIDNLLKGASGQAVQNMNLMFGLEEKSGLQLKASAF